MGYIVHLTLGFGMAFLGLVPPGMLNMTAVRTSIEKGLNSGLRFSAGAASVVIIQAFIALTFANYLSAHPEIFDILKKVAIGIFLLLAFFFYTKARKKFKAEGKQKKGNSFYSGILMSSLNALAIPFYFGFSSVMENKGYIILQQPYISVFVLGAVVGAFSLFATYAKFAETIVKRAQFIAKNINYILSGLFVVLAIVQVISLI
jgi:threonine/homoserine/homoserine lactone efflux protein